MIIKKPISSLIESPVRLFVIFLTLNLIAFSGIAQSAIVFLQEPLDGGDAPASFFEEQTADNFILINDTEIGALSWWGSYSVNSLQDDFDILFFHDNNGLPSDTHFKQFSVNASRTPTTLKNVAGGEVFLFKASLSNPLDSFRLLENTNYYVSIVHPGNDGASFWLLSDITGSNFTRNVNPTADNSWKKDDTVPGNLAFALIPEPNPLSLFILVFISLFFYRRTFKI